MAEEKEKKIEVETLASDLASVVAENQEGVLKKIIEEQEKEENEKQKVSPERKRNVIFLIISAILVVLAFSAVFLVFLFREDILINQVTPQYTPIIFTDQSSFLDVSGLKKEAIAQAVSDQINNVEIKEGGIDGIYFKEKGKILGFKKFLELIEANLDKSKIEFISDNFLAGILKKEKKEFFFLIKMRSIADVFDVIRAWESKMFLDLHQFFGMDLNPENKYLLEKNFEDGIVQNKNARILRDDNGNIVMMYVFAEDDSLVIANSEKAVEELILRIASSKVKK